MVLKYIIQSTAIVFAILAIVSSTFTLTPRTAYALDGGGSLAVFAKEMADAIGWIFADEMIGAISNQTFQWSSEGFGMLTVSVDPGSLGTVRSYMSGDRSFLDDPEGFFRGIGDDITTQFITELKGVAGGIRDGVIEGIALSARSQGDSASSRLTTTIDEKILKDFTSGDFGSFASEGAWGTWLQLTNNPQNYFDGAMQIALSELNQMKQSAVERNKEELAQSGGFLTMRRCQTLDDIELRDPTLREYAKVDEFGCAAYENVTPGKLIGDKVSSAITSDMSRIEGADEITEIIAALITTAIDQLVQAGFSEIVNVTQKFGSPSRVEQKGTSEVAKLQQEMYSVGGDGTGEGEPPPPSPLHKADWNSAPEFGTDSVARGPYWAQLTWTAPASGRDSDEILGYAIYRGEVPTDEEKEIKYENIATMSKETGTLKKLSEGVYDLSYVDNTLNPNITYEYYIVAFDLNYNRSQRSPIARVSLTTEEGEERRVYKPEVDVVPMLKLTGGGGIVLGGEAGYAEGLAAGGYYIEVGSYWGAAHEDIDLSEIEVPRHDTVVTIRNSEREIIEQIVMTYGKGGEYENGVPMQHIVNILGADGKGMYVDVEVRADASNKVKESNEANNTRTLRVHVRPEDNPTLPPPAAQ